MKNWKIVHKFVILGPDEEKMFSFENLDDKQWNEITWFFTGVSSSWDMYILVLCKI